MDLRHEASSTSLQDAQTNRSQFWLMLPDEISIYPTLQRSRRSGNVSYPIKVTRVASANLNRSAA